MKKFKIKKGDEVIVIAGKDKGKKGIVSKIITKKDRVLIDGINIVKKHKRSPNPENKKPSIVEEPAPLHISNIMYFCSKCNKGVKIGYKETEEGKKVRFCKKCETIIK